MPTRTYIQKKFRGEALAIIDRANAICRSYRAQGYDLTLRQLYYQFVQLGLIPNKDTEYKRLGSIINDARLAGYLDWDFIVDRTRNVRKLAHWDSPSDIIDAVASQYREDKWAAQDTHIEVWIEKDALVGVLGNEETRRGVCPENDVPYFSCRGYTSQSEIWGAAQRLGDKIREDKKVVIIHLGDHDPSGIDMSRDIEDRLALFIAQDLGDIYYEDSYDEGGDGYKDLIYNCKDALLDRLVVHRIALNLDQIRAFNPPPNPAKLTDARAKGYIREFGTESWELDALDPATLTALIQAAIDEEKDPLVWADSVEHEETNKGTLQAVSDRWDEVTELLEAS